MTKPTIHRMAVRSRCAAVWRWLLPRALDRHGAISVEYVVIIGTVAISASAAIAALGPPLLQGYDAARAIVMSPVP